MSNVFGGCLDKHTLWTTETDENGITTVTFTSNVEDQEDVSICFGLKGATINGEPVAIEDGILLLEDMFGTGVVDSEAGTYTLTLPGEDPVVLCTDPFKAFEQDADTGVITATSQSGEEFTAETRHSTTVPSADGTFHTIITDDNVPTSVCLEPVKDIRPDPATGEMVAYGVNPDTGEEYEVERWFNAAPENRTKLQIVAVDGEVEDGNGNSVPAMALGGQSLVMQDCVAVECDPDGNVVRVKKFDFDTTVLSETPDGTVRPINPVTNNQIITQSLTWTQIVDDDGNVTNPYTGEVSASGLAPGLLVTSHTDENGLGATSCPAESYSVNLCKDRETGEAVHSKSITDLKTGVETDYVFYTNIKAVTAPVSVVNLDSESPTAPNFLVINEATAPEWGCPALVGTMRFKAQMNADASPAGAPNKFINIRFRVNGGAWTNFDPLQSLSTSLLGVNGATGSDIPNQEMVISGCRTNVSVPSGALIEFGVATSGFDAGQGIQLQSIRALFEYAETRCKEAS